VLPDHLHCMSEEEPISGLVESCGKFIVLDKLLQELLPQKRKVKWSITNFYPLRMAIIAYL
jgi:hypothetical protein